MGGLHGKCALVTGAARGIGKATALELAAQGAAVLACDVSDAEPVAAEIRARDERAEALRLDVTREEDWRAAVARAETLFGRLDVLVNNAGVVRLEDVENETLDGWNQIVAVNQTGAWLGMKTCAAALRRAGGGSIVNVSSIFAAVGGMGVSAAYHAAKGAVRTLTKNAAIRWAKEGIRVNSVHPGFVETDFIKPAAEAGALPLLIAQTPMGRLGKPAEIARVIAFLAGDGASYVTGAELYVDGGYTAA